MLRLDEKLARIRKGEYAVGDFIIADASDCEGGSGRSGRGRARPRDC